MGVEGVLREMYADAQRRWPGITTDFAAFQQHCLRLLGPAPSPDALQFGADLYLCCACARRDAEAMLAFERETAAVARSAIARVNRDPEFVAETLRRLWDKLLFGNNAKVSEYSGRGPLNAWVRVAAARTALACCRAQRLTWSRQADLSEAIADESCGPESQLTKVRYQGAFQHALEHALATLSSRDRNVLRMHAVDRCSIDQIGRAYGVHRATAARWLERAKAGIFASVREELAIEHAAMTDSEFKSLAQLMGSELELSLSVRPAEAGCAQPPGAG